MPILIFAILLGLVPAAIAKHKGRSFALWWLYGSLILIVALPHALIMRPKAERIEAQAIANGGRKCPFCAEIIKAEANVCRFCGRDLAGADPKIVGGIVIKE
jgi:hypothetical protein